MDVRDKLEASPLLNCSMNTNLRSPKGTFLAAPNSLGKTIGLRLPKDMELAFRSLAARRQTTPAELAREIVLAWIEEQGRDAEE